MFFVTMRMLFSAKQLYVRKKKVIAIHRIKDIDINNIKYNKFRGKRTNNSYLF